MTVSTSLRNLWRADSLENLENEKWSCPTFESYLLTTCYKLRKKPLNEFEIEDIRILIGQGIGMEYLVPMAIDVLKEDILAEGHFYEGDLLKCVLTSKLEYWQVENEKWQMIYVLFRQHEEVLSSFDTSNSIRKGLFEAFDDFLKIHEA